MPVDLGIRSVLAETWSLYRRLFVRSAALGLAIFVLVELVQVLANRTLTPAMAGLITLSLTLAGTSILQGALVEVVRDLHEGAEPGDAFEHYERATTRFGALVGVSLLAGLGIGLGIVALIVPGLVLATRWALIVPVVMLEGASPRAALRRSRELVCGHGRAVFVVLLNVFLRVGVVGVLFALLTSAAGGSFLVTWLVGALGSALTTPYAAHAMTVVYYRIVDPGRPLVAEPARWTSGTSRTAPRSYSQNCGAGSANAVTRPFRRSSMNQIRSLPFRRTVSAWYRSGCSESWATAPG